MIIVALGLLGLIFGSFVNAVIWRLHEQAALQGKKTKAAVKRLSALSITKGRSMCSSCSHELAPKDLVPVLSWLWLHGRCRYCHAPIPDSPLVELVTSLLFVVSYAAWPLAFHGVGLFQFILWLVFVVAFMVLAVYDLRWFLLPNRVVLPLIALAAGEVLLVSLWTQHLGAVWQPVAGAAIIFGLFWTLFQISDGRWIGGGDVKLAVVLGLLAGTPLKAFLVIFFASLIGTVVSLPVLLKGRSSLKLHIPFGPYLLLATFIVVLYGTQIVTWYENLLGM